MHTPSTLPVRRGVLYIALAATAWGTGGAVAAVLYDIGGLGPIAVSFWRFLSGLVVLLLVHWARQAYAATRRPSLWRCFADHKRQALLTGVGIALYQTAYFAAVQQAGLTVATVVTLGAGPVLVAVGGRVLLAERVGTSGTLAVATGVTGLVLLTAGADQGIGPNPELGLLYALLSATGYAGVTLIGRASGGDGSGDVLQLTLTGFAVGTVFLLPFALLEGLWPSTEHLGWTLAALVYIGAVPNALAYLLFFGGLRVVRAVTASVVVLVEPLTAAVIGIALFGERLTGLVAGGTGLLFCAVLFLSAKEPATETATTDAATPADTAPRTPAN